MAAVCKTVGFAYPGSNLDLPGQQQQPFIGTDAVGPVALLHLAESGGDRPSTADRGEYAARFPRPSF